MEAPRVDTYQVTDKRWRDASIRGLKQSFISYYLIVKTYVPSENLIPSETYFAHWSPLFAIVTCCHQVCVPPSCVCTASCANIGPAPQESAVRDTAGWRLNLGNIKIRELMQIANSFKRFSSHSKDQGVEPGWFAFQWALSKLIWYHLDLWPNETNDNKTSWTF